MRCYVTPSYLVLCDDQLSEGWYRFVGAERTNTPTNHVARFGYGTRYSGWLDGAYPSVEDGEVSKTICFTFPLYLVKTQREFLWRVVDHTISTNFSSLQAVIRATVAHTKCEINNLMKLEDLQINPSFYALRSGIEHCLIGKESEETFPLREQCLSFKKTDFFF